MKLKFLQEGGAMPEQAAPAPAPGGGQAPAGPNPDQIMQLVQELINALGPEGAAMVAQMIMQTLQGGGAPAPEQPALQRMGGVLRRIK